MGTRTTNYIGFYGHLAILALKITPYISRIMRVYIVWVKNLAKHFIFLPNRMFCQYLTRWHFCEVLTKWQVNMTLQFLVMCFCGLSRDTFFTSFLWASRKLHWFNFEAWFFTNLSQSSLTIKTNINTIKFSTELKSTKVSWKSQLYKCILLSLMRWLRP